MRENILLALGQLILFFLTGSLDFQQAPGHQSRGLTTSHIWDCQKLPQKSPPQRACGNCWGGRAWSSQKPHQALCQPGGPWHYILSRAGPKPLPFLQLTARTFPSITGLIQKELTGVGLHSQTEKEKRENWEQDCPTFSEMNQCTFWHPLSDEFLLPWTSLVNEKTEEPFLLQATSRVSHSQVPAVGLDLLFLSQLLSDTAGSSIKAHFPLI